MVVTLAVSSNLRVEASTRTGLEGNQFELHRGGCGAVVVRATFTPIALWLLRTCVKRQTLSTRQTHLALGPRLRIPQLTLFAIPPPSARGTSHHIASHRTVAHTFSDDC